MNPSASGWINKLFQELTDQKSINSLDLNALYLNLRTCGFTYGSNINIVFNSISKNDFTNDEICKINLILALHFTHEKSVSELPFIDNLISFYSEIDQQKAFVFKDLLIEKNSPDVLEKIINKRVLIDTNLFTKTFNYFIINALLFIDVLAYKHFLETGHITEKYIKQKEAAIETIVLNALNAKEVKTEYDSNLINLMEQSLRYEQNTKISYIKALLLITNPLEAQYILDLACMSTWSDATIDASEHKFLYQLGADLKLKKNIIEQSIKAIHKFYNVHTDEIALLGSKNIVKTFYDNSSKMVSKLISRNSKRLQKELTQSKELMILLTQSTLRELTEEEHKKVQGQLLDIIKSIPSLAIFILPGGAILLPLVIKFIPKLLPSAFDDNRIEDNK